MEQKIKHPNIKKLVEDNVEGFGRAYLEACEIFEAGAMAYRRELIRINRNKRKKQTP